MRPGALQLSTIWEPYSLTGGTKVVLPEGGPYAGRGVAERMAARGMTISHAVEQPELGQATTEEAPLLGAQRGSLETRVWRISYADVGRPVESAHVVVSAARGEVLYEVQTESG